MRIGWWTTNMPSPNNELKIHTYEYNYANPQYPWLSKLPSGEPLYWNNNGETSCCRYKLGKFISPTRDKNPGDINFMERRLKHAKATVRALQQHITDLKSWNKD